MSAERITTYRGIFWRGMSAGYLWNYSVEYSR